MNNALQGATVLITGGTGTFGTAFTEHCVLAGAGQIRILSRDEKKQHEMAQRFAESPCVKFYIGDIRDRASVDTAMQGADYVFHAAAMKHVPICEAFPMEAMKTNVLGSDNVLQSAIAHGVKKVVCLSTDKAVNPASVMGLTKAMMERMALHYAKSQTGTQICVTRFCNLIASNGSVVPLFIRQGLDEEPLTVTDPDMTRFMMTVQDAVELVDKAFSIGNNGEILIRQAQPCRIGDLARAVIRCLCLPEDHPVHIIGARPGERKHEALMADEEAASSVVWNDYIAILPGYRNDSETRIPCRSDETDPMGIEALSRMIRRAYR